MTKHVFCDWVGQQIRCRSVRRQLLRELSGHMEDHQAELEAEGLSPQEAEDRAVEAIAMMVQGDCAGAMNHYNKKVER